MKTTSNKTMIWIRTLLSILVVVAAGTQWASAGTATLEVRKKAESQIKNIVDPIINQYCREQCKLISVQAEVDLAVEEDVAPGFEEGGGAATLAPASGKVTLLVDKNMGKNTQNNILNVVRESLKSLDYPVDVDYTATAFPQPAATGYKVAELRERVTKDIKSSITGLVSQFCPNHCVLGEFDVQSEVVNPEDVDYGASQDFFIDGTAAIRVKNVKATLMIDETIAPEEANGLVQMARLKLSQFKSADINAQAFRFPTKNGAGNENALAQNSFAGGRFGVGREPASVEGETKTKTEELRDQKLSSLIDSKEQVEKIDTVNKNENSSVTSNASSNTNNKVNTKESNTNELNENKQEKFERYERIERVENGDAVQQVLDKFRVYGLVVTAIVLALLMTLVAISFRSLFWEGKSSKHSDGGSSGKSHEHGPRTSHASESSSLTNDEKASLISKRIEADRLHTELTQIFSEQPKVAKHVFGQVLTEEGVETTGQYVELFGESIMLDLLKDPGLQADLTELMDFYARNTFDINDEERLQLLRRLHHRTVSSKMALHSSRSAALFDFLAEMDAPQVFEMVKNESNTVKAIVLTQCDSKKRQVIFANHDDSTRIKLMTELSRIDHLPKNYIFNVAAALRRKKAENPRLNTEALPGTDVLVSFLERSSMATQRNIIQQLMSNSSDVLHSLKSKLVSVETLRFLKDTHMVEVITSIKHDELIQFLQGCSSEVREAVLVKGPQDLSAEVRDELALVEPVSKETYMQVERKVLNRIKVMANQGALNLSEVNEKMFASEFGYMSQSEVSSIDAVRKIS